MGKQIIQAAIVWMASWMAIPAQATDWEQEAHIALSEDQQEIQELRRQLKELQRRLDTLERHSVPPPELLPQEDHRGKEKVYPVDTRHAEPSHPPKARIPERLPDPFSQRPMPPGWHQGPMPLDPRPVDPKQFSKAMPGEKLSPYRQARQYLLQGKVEPARALLKDITHDKRHPHYGEALYWLGTIALLQDKKPEEASSLFSRAYQYCDQSVPKKSLLLRQSILIKLAESLYLQKKYHASRIVLEQFFLLYDTPAPAEDKVRLKALYNQGKKLADQLATVGEKLDHPSHARH